ncbi:hypothetical protein [Microbacterium sp.]|uniref:hypothetical protein n=1 Tax=Microbacterium sp. TaxID=51671 RepID=UPI0039E3DE8F
MTTLPPPDCAFGYTQEQVNDLLGDGPAQQAFWDWMYGQTQALCTGEQYSHTEGHMVPNSCAGHPHGPVVYTWDFARYWNHVRSRPANPDGSPASTPVIHD